MANRLLTIAAGAAVSEEFGMQDRNIGLGLICPSDWTAADLGFEVSLDGTTWYLLKTETGTLKFTSLATSGGFARALVDLGPVSMFPKVRLKSINTSTEAAVNQAAARSISLFVASLNGG